MKNYINQAIKLNKSIFENRLSILNFGNASIVDRKKKKIFIKASGIYPSKVDQKKIVVAKYNSDNSYNIVYNKNLKPSVDISLHIRIYNNYKNINSIIHTHSDYATILAQLKIEPNCIGTTHADFYDKSIPLSKNFTMLNNNKENYNEKLFKSIKKRLDKEKNFPPGILLRSHGLLAWSENTIKTIENSIGIEFICKIFYYSLLKKKTIILDKNLTRFHYNRKNSKKNGYGQSI